jgi:sugar/nucleoside kinase (ribokinase family)
MKHDVVTIGMCIVDVFLKPVDELPKLGRAMPIEQMEMHAGGCAVNTAIALRKLGHTAAHVGSVGADAYGDYLQTQLSEHGVDIRGVVRDTETGTACCVMLLSREGERRSLLYYGAMSNLRADDIDRKVLHDACILHVGGLYHTPQLLGAPLAGLLQDARQQGQIVSVDAQYNWREPHHDALKMCLPHVDYFFISVEEAVDLAGSEEPSTIAAYFLEMGATTVVVKNGAQGSHLYDCSGGQYIPALPVDAQDTTGAGDSYAAGFLAAICRDKTAREAAEMGTATAGLCVKHIGTTTGILPYAETQKFYWDSQNST